VKALKNHGSGVLGKEALELLNPDFKDDAKFIEGFEKYYNYLIGYNSRLDEMQAAILNVKLKYIDEWNQKRRNIAARYKEKLNEKFVFQKETDDSEMVYHIFSVQSKDKFWRLKEWEALLFILFHCICRKHLNILDIKKGICLL